MVIIFAAIWGSIRQTPIEFARAAVRGAARALGKPLELTDETDSGAQSASSEYLFEDVVAVGKCTQSMTTYTSLRGTGTARFQPISLELSCAWDELDRKLPMVHLQ